MPSRGLTHVGTRNHVLDGVQISQGKEQFLGVIRLTENHSDHCCGLRSKKINNGMSATAAADCIPPYLRCHINFFFRKKSAPAMRPIVKIL